jgi:hypothetical protein
LGTPPISVFSDDRSRIVEVRTRAVAILERWEADDPVGVRGLIDRIPAVLQLPSSAQSLLEAAPWEDYFAIPQSVLLPPDQGSRVFAAVPELLERLDDDGLLEVAGLDARPHGLFFGELSLHYHQLLRRGFGSNIHYELLGTLLAIADRQSVSARVAIDERRLRFRSEHEAIEERDYWYGPPLSESALDDPDLGGETIHGDPEQGRSLLNPYAALSVRWTRDGPLKTVEIEELVPIRSEDEDKPVLARYLHAIRDTSTRTFVHCDGAVKAYEHGHYPTTIQEFPRRGKGTHYRKVFRLDGQLATGEWSTLTALWFRGNRLILEYLSALPGDGASLTRRAAARSSRGVSPE